MNQFLHLLLLERSTRRALVTNRAGLWILPVICAPETSRAGLVVREWLRQRGARGVVVGQWLGRVSPRQTALDWLVIVTVRGEDLRDTDRTLDWVEGESLVLGHSAVDYQQWAVARTLATGDGPAVPGPFGDLTWPDRVTMWVSEALNVDLFAAGAEATWHRSSPYEVVVEWWMPQGRWFFKGLASHRRGEAEATRRIAALLPDWFPRTVALEIRSPDTAWWLMQGCPGILLAERLTPRGALCAARAYATVQQQLIRVLADGVESPFPLLDLSMTQAWALQMLSDQDRVKDRQLTAIVDACGAVIASADEISWVAPDLDPTNVLIDHGQVRFIDLDDAALGPAPLGMATLARRLQTVRSDGPLGQASMTTAVEAYCQAWSPPLELERRWSSFALISQILECQLAWHRVVNASRRGDIHGALELARSVTIQRVLRAVEEAIAN